MGLHKDAVAASRHRRAREEWGKATVATTGGTFAAGPLYGMGGIEDDAQSVFLHPGDSSHVCDKVVIAEAGSPLGKEIIFAAEGVELVGYVLNVPRRKKLALFYIYDPPCLCRCFDKVGLAAEKGGDLKDVMMLRFPIPSTLLLILMSVFASLPAEGKAQAGDSAATGEAAAGKVVKSALPAELTAHFPIGREFKGLAIPSYTNDVLKSVMRADSVIRVDEQFLDLINLTVQVYNSKGEPETTISMTEASYDLIIGELASKTPSRIEQPRFTMTGDKMTFQTDSQVARLIGNVKLAVPDVGRLAPGFGVPTGKPADKPTP